MREYEISLINPDQLLYKDFPQTSQFSREMDVCEVLGDVYL